jgi:hypothetical protein
MLLNALQQMRLARLLTEKAKTVPLTEKGKYLQHAALWVALARHQAKNPHLSSRNQQLRRGENIRRYRP